MAPLAALILPVGERPINFCYNGPMRKMIVANWKMNPATPREAKELYQKTKRLALGQNAAQVVVCPPAIFLGFLNHRDSARLRLGVQDVAMEQGTGAYTGAISAAMTRYVGAEYTIVGHSERRSAGDTDEIVNLKVKSTLAAKLKVILCIGENERDHDGRYLKVLSEQLESSLDEVPKNFFKNLVIAYEPVWAVGEGALAVDTPADFLHHKLFIHKVISHMVGGRVAKAVPVLYGGSVNVKNAADFINHGQADGLLVGRESLRPDHFKQIIHAAH